MPKYLVTVVFDRIVRLPDNTKRIDRDQQRQGTAEASTGELAKAKYLRQFKKNEPDRRKIHRVTVEKFQE